MFSHKSNQCPFEHTADFLSEIENIYNFDSIADLDKCWKNVSVATLQNLTILLLVCNVKLATLQNLRKYDFENLVISLVEN